MYAINFFIIPIILVSVFYNNIKFSYVISFLCSFGAATFVYAQESIANILFTIVIFNVTPLLCLRFRRVWGKFRLSWEEKKSAEKQSYEQMLKERSVIRGASSELSKDASRVVELYRISRDMSAVLEVEEIFNILGKKLIQNFRFSRCRLILIDENVGALKIKKVLELEYRRSHTRQVDATEQDRKILKESLGAQQLKLIEKDSLILLTLLVNNKFLGVLAIEDLPAGAMENFFILANRFSLEFKRIALYQKLQELAITDGLTGLFVRRYFLQRLAQELGRSSRRHLKLTFLMLDIDRFKQCNDRFGHLTGDVVLKEIAGKIKACVREIDLVARYGGEEFAVLLPDTDTLGASFVAERIRSSVAKQKINAYDENIRVEVSIGVAVFPEDSTTVQELVDRADQALYRAKQEGRNRVCFFTT